MKHLIILTLALIVAGCCTWKDRTNPDFWHAERLWSASQFSASCNGIRGVYVHKLPPNPENHLYVLEDRKWLPDGVPYCLAVLRPAVASDTACAFYRWEDLPSAFNPCN